MRPPRSLFGEHGYALIELALALPILLAVVGGIIDGGWAFHQAGLVAAAAEAAQRAVAVEDTGSGHCAGAPPASYLETARRAAHEAAPHLDPAALEVALGYLEPACDGRMRTLTVSLEYPATALTPWLAPLLAGRRLTGQASSAVEELPPPWWGQGDTVQAQQTQIETQQAQIASLTSAYTQAAARVQSQQAQISSLASSYQAEAAQAASLSQTADYYYNQWQGASATASALSRTAGYYYNQWQGAAATASSLSQTLGYYYAQWQNTLRQVAALPARGYDFGAH